MSSNKKKKLTQKQAVKQLSSLMGELLEQVPAKERRKRLELAHKRLIARTRKKRASRSGASPYKSQEHGSNEPVRLVARSRS
jgi:hypothetical protein